MIHVDEILLINPLLHLFHFQSLIKNKYEINIKPLMFLYFLISTKTINELVTKVANYFANVRSY